MNNQRVVAEWVAIYRNLFPNKRLLKERKKNFESDYKDPFRSCKIEALTKLIQEKKNTLKSKLFK